MNPVAYDTDDFLLARVVTAHEADGSAINAVAMWWPTTIPQFGTTWSLHYTGKTRRSGPAVVDDFGDLVLVGWRL
jgi:hypothetical protein